MRTTIARIGVVLSLLTIIGCSDNPKTDTPPLKQQIAHPIKIVDHFDKQDPNWQFYGGIWVVSNRTLIQTATDVYFPLALRQKEKFSTVDISVRFKPLSGRIDASGGIVFRATDEENYYIVRANALEGNYRLYYFKEGSRYQIASATVTAPTLGKWHTMRVVAQGDHIQAYLDGTLYLDHHDSRYSSGYVGLWTKADSVTAFDDLEVVGE